MKIIFKYRINIIIVLFSFIFIFSAFDKFPFQAGEDDKLHFYQQSEVNFKNFSKYIFIRDNIDKIIQNCNPKHKDCFKEFRMRGGLFLNYLYTQKIYKIVDSFFLLNHKNNYNIQNDKYTLHELNRISKVYNYSIIFSYLLLIFFTFFIFLKFNKQLSLVFLSLLFSIILTNAELFNFQLSAFNEVFHKNPKWGTITEMEPKGMIGFFILISSTMFICSHFRLFLIPIILMNFIHFGQAIFIQLFFIQSYLIYLLFAIFFRMEKKILTLISIVTIFFISYLILGSLYVTDNDKTNLILEFIKYFFSIENFRQNIFNLIFYISLLPLTYYLIYQAITKNYQYKNYLINFLILGISSVYFLEFLRYFKDFFINLDSNEFTLLYDRILGNLYFIEFSYYSIIFITLVILFFKLYSRSIHSKQKFMILMIPIIITAILIVDKQTKIGSGIKTNFYNASLILNKFNVSYFEELKFKIENLPHELNLKICGGKKISKAQGSIVINCYYELTEKNSDTMLTRKYEVFTEIQKLFLKNDKELNEDIIKLNINPKIPYLYMIQLHNWYKI